ncbi:hypothetical protein Tco_0819899 [Tanacetum coccineum]|uniref:Uncharacterized protein n=1 Tax=Tanacetum coccineum TaxID=301880 RepID=A0ABQ5A7X0_9ASTR
MNLASSSQDIGSWAIHSAMNLSVLELLLPSSAKATVFLRDVLALVFSPIELDARGKETLMESGSKFIPCFDSSFVEFIQPCFCFPNSEEFMNVFMRIGFGSTIELVSFDKGQVVTFDSKFVCGFRNSELWKAQVGRSDQHGQQPTWVHHPLEKDFQE